MNSLTTLEAAVLGKILSGDHPTLVVLREQLATVEVVRRELTGVGFFTSLRVGVDQPCARTKSGRIGFGDVTAKIDGLEHGAGFVLFVVDGYLDLLEGYCFDEAWPAAVGSFELEYVASERDLASLLAD